MAAAWVLGGLAAGCAPDKGAGEFHAAGVLLEREVKGLRESVAKLHRGEPLFPEEAVVVSIAERGREKAGTIKKVVTLGEGG